MADDFVVELRVDLTGDLNGQISRQLGDASRQFNDFDSKVAKTQKTLDGAGKSQKDFQQSLSTTRYALYDVSSTLTMTGIALLGVSVATAAVAIAWERDFANVARTTGLVGNELQDMRGELVGLAQTMPAAFGDITKIATLGAQLGIANEDLSEFTTTVIKFSSASGISAEESAQAFGRLGNILGVSADAYDNLGSSIVKAGISAVATESEIVAVAQQIGPIARLAGASASQVIGLATAFASVKIPPELARSVITKTFGDITRAVANGGPKLEAFGKALGTSGAEFRTAWNQDATGTFVKFLEAIPKDAGGAIRTLDELGLSSQRNTPALQKLAQNTGLVRQSLEEAGVGFSENSELNRQYGIIAETTAARLQVLANNFLAFLDAVGGANLGPIGDSLDFLASVLKNLTDFASTDIGGRVLGIVAALGALVGVLALVAGGLALMGASSIGLTQGLLGLHTIAPRATAAIIGTGTAAAVASGEMTAAAVGAKALGTALKAISLIGIALILPDIADWLDEGVRGLQGFSNELDDVQKRLSDSNFGGDLFLGADVAKMDASFQAIGRSLGGIASRGYEDIKKLDEGWAEAAKSGNIQSVRQEYERMEQQWKDAGGSTDAFKAAFIDTTNALKDTGPVTDAAAGTFATLDEAMANTADEAQATQDAINALKDAILNFGNTSISVEETNIAMSRALNSMAEAAADGEASLTGTNGASLELRQSYIDTEKAARDAAIAILDNGGEVEDATKKYNEGRDAIIKSRIAKGEDATAAAAWADAVLGNAAEAEAAIAAYSAEIKRVPKSTTTTFYVNASGAYKSTQDLINWIQSRRPTLTINEVYVETSRVQSGGRGHQVIGKATGGPIYGPGTGTSDSIPAMLSNGEYVVRAAAVAKYGQGFMNAINSGRAPKFASGGAVSASSITSNMGGVMELGPKTLARLGRDVTNNIMIDDIAISRAAESGNAKRRGSGELR